MSVNVFLFLKIIKKMNLNENIYFINENICIFVEKYCKMDNKTYNDFTLSKVKELFLKDDIINLGDDFILARQNNNIDLQLLKYPSRINGFIAAYCKQGRFRCKINLTEYEVHDGMLVLNIPDNIIQMTPVSDGLVEMTILAVSPQFMTTWRSDLNKIFIDAITVLKNPIIEMFPEEVELASGYFALIDKIVNSDTSYKMESIGYLLTSVFYLIGGFVKRRISDGSVDKSSNTRHKKMFESFLELVENYHITERKVGFYADKLCITPKYLSKIIKNVSGMSASDIIDNYVILEAQHLLRHTDLTAKEIADKLNFANQSFFHKYFKSHTGQTPNEYRGK